MIYVPQLGLPDGIVSNDVSLVPQDVIVRYPRLPLQLKVCLLVINVLAHGLVFLSRVNFLNVPLLEV